MTYPALEPTRCAWPGLADPLYVAYHDTEWGVPHSDETRLFEKLVLEGFQAGLSWLTILRKREAFRAAFHGFDPARVARYDDRDVARLMADTGIVRHRGKIEAAIASARAYLALREEVTLAAFLWRQMPAGPVVNSYARHGDVPPVTEVSQRLSKALKARGFKFVGPTTMYAFMQSSGMVNDHLTGCHRHAPCAALQRAFVVPRAAGTGAAS
jgi:DNA-3-methyladenine glycosylase I